MAEVRISGTPSLATLLPEPAHQINGLKAGAAIAVGQFCYIKAADGLVYPASGAAATEVARARGVVLQAAQVGDGVTIMRGVAVRWGAGLSPGAPYFLSGTNAGELVEAASTGGTTEIAYAIDATRIFVKW